MGEPFFRPKEIRQRAVDAYKILRGGIPATSEAKAAAAQRFDPHAGRMFSPASAQTGRTAMLGEYLDNEAAGHPVVLGLSPITKAFSRAADMFYRAKDIYKIGVEGKHPASHGAFVEAVERGDPLADKMFVRGSKRTRFIATHDEYVDASEKGNPAAALMHRAPHLTC